MKLLYCIECHDVRRIGLGTIVCSSAWFVSGQTKNLVTFGPSLILALPDENFTAALFRKTEVPALSQKIDLIFLPEPCSTVKRI